MDGWLDIRWCLSTHFPEDIFISIKIQLNIMMFTKCYIKANEHKDLYTRTKLLSIFHDMKAQSSLGWVKLWTDSSNLKLAQLTAHSHEVKTLITIHHSIYLSIHQSFYLPISPSIYLSIHHSLTHSLSLSITLSIHHSLHYSLTLSMDGAPFLCLMPNITPDQLNKLPSRSSLDSV